MVKKGYTPEQRPGRCKAARPDLVLWSAGTIGLIANNLTTEKQVPNFLDYIYEDGLKAVKPEAVNIIR